MLSAGDGTPLAYYEWQTEAPTAAVLIVHGFGEHLGRYEWLAEQLSGAGYLVGGIDHRGMGLSGGTRGYIKDFNDYIADLNIAQAHLRTKLKADKPLFIYAHSMGGLVAFLHACRFPEQTIAGTVLSGPMLGLAFPVPGWQVTLGGIFRSLLPEFKVPAPLRPELLTHDEEERVQVASDTLMVGFVTLGWYFASVEAMAQAPKEAQKICWPTLWVIGGSDPVCSPDVSKSVYQSLSDLERHRWNLYPGLLHEIHKEGLTDRMRLRNDVLTWFETHLTG